jgi:ParB family chromosome partitioning protein
MKLNINPKFETLLCPLTAHEFTHLEQSILSEGCREKILVWSKGDVIVDGHNRYAICTNSNIPFEIERVDFESEEAVEDWIDRNQLSRRNVHPDEFKIISGRIYNRRKKAHGGDRKSSGQVDHLTERTADEVATELGTNERTIRRNAKRAEVYDDLVDAGEEEAAEAVKHVKQSVVDEAAKQQEPKKAAEVVKRSHVQSNSGNNEWYTPSEYLDAAREVMGQFDVDPASCEVAQKNVGARTFFTESDDGLQQDWRGKVWMNPPYGSSLIGAFCDKLITEFSEGRCTDAIVLVNNATETRWFQLLGNHCSAACFPCGRIQFLDSTGTIKNSPVQGQCFLYFGKDADLFTAVFSRFGFVVQH